MNDHATPQATPLNSCKYTYTHKQTLLAATKNSFIFFLPPFYLLKFWVDIDHCVSLLCTPAVMDTSASVPDSADAKDIQFVEPQSPHPEQSSPTFFFFKIRCSSPQTIQMELAAQTSYTSSNTWRSPEYQLKITGDRKMKKNHVARKNSKEN